MSFGIYLVGYLILIEWSNVWRHTDACAYPLDRGRGHRADRCSDRVRCESDASKGFGIKP